MNNSSEDIIYREYEKDDEKSIIQLFNLVFQKKINLSYWNWAFNENIIKHIHCSLAFDKKQLVAQSAAIPLTLIVDGKETSTARVQNVMCDNNYRNRGIFYNTLNKLTESLRNKKIDFIFTFPNNNSIHTFVKKLNYKHLTDIYTYSLSIDKINFNTTKKGVKVIIENNNRLSPPDLDFIKSRLTGYKIYSLKTSDYFNWRYSKNSGNEYRFVRIFENDVLKGLVICKIYGNSVDLVEFFVKPDTSMINTIFIEIFNYYKKQNITSLNIWMMEHYHFYNELIKLGFEKTEMCSHLLYLKLSDTVSNCSDQKNSYYLSMGDSDVF